MALVTIQRSPSVCSSPPSSEYASSVHSLEDDVASVKSLSEYYFAVKGFAVLLPKQECQQARHKKLSVPAADIQTHLQSILHLLRPGDILQMAVRLESDHIGRTRYLVVVEQHDTFEACLLGVDFSSVPLECPTVGLVLPLYADTSINLDGDGGFSVSSGGRKHIFKPVSVQAMWSALQTVHKESSKARDNRFYSGGLNHAWVSHYVGHISSDQSCINEWHVMEGVESKRPPSPDALNDKEETEHLIRSKLKEIMMNVNIDEVTSKYIRQELEQYLTMDLFKYKSFIDQEMLTILGQMDTATEIFPYVYLGSEWNASNLEELKKNQIGYILNVTKEIDNFFPGMFEYLNIRVYDDEKTELLKHWDDTYKYISQVKEKGSKVLVHCKMGISRSASVVIAYTMKALNITLEEATKLVRDKRNCINPNSAFTSQLKIYEGILDASKQRHNVLFRSKSENNLKSNFRTNQLKQTDRNADPISPPSPDFKIRSISTTTSLCSPSSAKEENKSRIKSEENGIKNEEKRHFSPRSSTYNMLMVPCPHFGIRPRSWSPDDSISDRILSLPCQENDSNDASKNISQSLNDQSWQAHVTLVQRGRGPGRKVGQNSSDEKIYKVIAEAINPILNDSISDGQIVETYSKHIYPISERRIAKNVPGIISSNSEGQITKTFSGSIFSPQESNPNSESKSLNSSPKIEVTNLSQSWDPSSCVRERISEFENSENLQIDDKADTLELDGKLNPVDCDGKSSLQKSDIIKLAEIDCERNLDYKANVNLEADGRKISMISDGKVISVVNDNKPVSSDISVEDQRNLSDLTLKVSTENQNNSTMNFRSDYDKMLIKDEKSNQVVNDFHSNTPTCQPNKFDLHECPSNNKSNIVNYEWKMGVSWPAGFKKQTDSEVKRKKAISFKPAMPRQNSLNFSIDQKISNKNSSKFSEDENMTDQNMQVQDPTTDFGKINSSPVKVCGGFFSTKSRSRSSGSPPMKICGLNIPRGQAGAINSDFIFNKENDCTSRNLPLDSNPVNNLEIGRLSRSVSRRLENQAYKDLEASTKNRPVEGSTRKIFKNVDQEELMGRNVKNKINQENVSGKNGKNLETEGPSRNNSWGSFDSAVVLVEGDRVPSRHSSFGSGDTRTPTDSATFSRNSSFRCSKGSLKISSSPREEKENVPDRLLKKLEEKLPDVSTSMPDSYNAFLCSKNISALKSKRLTKGENNEVKFAPASVKVQISSNIDPFYRKEKESFSNPCSPSKDLGCLDLLPLRSKSICSHPYKDKNLYFKSSSPKISAGQRQLQPNSLKFSKPKGGVKRGFKSSPQTPEHEIPLPGTVKQQMKKLEKSLCLDHDRFCLSGPSFGRSLSSGCVCGVSSKAKRNSIVRSASEKRAKTDLEGFKGNVKKITKALEQQNFLSTNSEMYSGPILRRSSQSLKQKSRRNRRPDYLLRSQSLERLGNKNFGNSSGYFYKMPEMISSQEFLNKLVEKTQAEVQLLERDHHCKEQDEINVKDLVGLFEETKESSLGIKLRPSTYQGALEDCPTSTEFKYCSNFKQNQDTAKSFNTMGTFTSNLKRKLRPRSENIIERILPPVPQRKSSLDIGHRTLQKNSNNYPPSSSPKQPTNSFSSRANFPVVNGLLSKKTNKVSGTLAAVPAAQQNKSCSTEVRRKKQQGKTHPLSKLTSRENTL